MKKDRKSTISAPFSLGDGRRGKKNKQSNRTSHSVLLPVKANGLKQRNQREFFLPSRQNKCHEEIIASTGPLTLNRLLMMQNNQLLCAKLPVRCCCIQESCYPCANRWYIPSTRTGTVRGIGTWTGSRRAAGLKQLPRKNCYYYLLFHLTNEQSLSTFNTQPMVCLIFAH